jgi:type IV pilus secretin PilQ/predicted competence protein
MAGAEVVQTPAGTPVTAPPRSAPPVLLSPPPGNEPLITLHVDDLDVRKALEILSREAKVNILVSPGVSGRVTVDLHDKTLDEVLRAIGKLCDVLVHREKDIIYVITPAEQRSAEEDDLPVRVYHLNYVKSKDVVDMIKPLLSKSGTYSMSPDSEIGYPNNFVGAPTAGGGGGGGGGGGSTTKAGGNSLAGGEIVIVQDYEHVLKTIDRVIAQFDVQPIQVLIEAVIVQVTLDKNLDLGVNYAILDGSGNALGLVGNGSIINATAGFTPASVLAGASAGVANTIQSVTTATTGSPTTNTTTTSIGTSGEVNGNPVNGFSANTYGLKYGWTGKNVTGFISALQTRGETRVLAAPRILVLNKQPAEVHLGDQLGYATSIVSQTSTTQQVQFMNIGTQLRLRPFVSSDGMIRMEVHPERSTGDIDANGIPQTNTSEVTTNILIHDGTTVVIGGLMDTEIEKTVAGIPFLMDLPVLGTLFRHTTNTTAKKELVVILTPHICRPECPEATNYLGRPRALGLDERVKQVPLAEKKDGPSLYDIPPPGASRPGESAAHQ